MSDGMRVTYDREYAHVQDQVLKLGELVDQAIAVYEAIPVRHAIGQAICQTVGHTICASNSIRQSIGEAIGSTTTVSKTVRQAVGQLS